MTMIRLGIPVVGRRRISPTPPTTVSFGALTAAGAGGYPVSATAITSGDPSGHWQISGGLLSPSAAGDAADLAAGPYVLVLDDARSVIVTIAGAMRHARTGAEWIAALTAAGAGETVKLRSTTFAGTTAIPALSKTDVTVTQEPGAIVEHLEPTGLSGVTFAGLMLYKDNSAGPDYTTAASGSLVYLNGCDDLHFSNCSFLGHGGTTTALKRKRMGGLRGLDSTNITVDDDCLFDGLYNGITLHGGTNTITDNVIRRIFQDGIGGGSYSWDVQRNQFTEFQGDYGKGFTCTFDSGTPAIGDLFTSGTGTSQKVIEIVDQVPGQIACYYNLFAKPVSGEVYTCGSKQITLTSNGLTTFNGAAFDGIHGDAFQPITNAGISSDITKITFSDNRVFRTAAFDRSVRQVEQGCQGMLLADSGVYDILDIDVQGNLIIGGQGIAITVKRVLGGIIAFNTCLSAEYTSAPARIRVTESSGIAIYNNVGDNGTDGPIAGASPYLVDTDPTNSDLTITDKGGVRVTPAQQAANFPLVYAYPQTQAGLAPAAGSAVALANAGALNTDGTLRTKTPPAPPPANPTIVESATVDATVNNALTVTSPSFTPGAGANRRVIAEVMWKNTSTAGSNQITGVQTGGAVAFTQIAQYGDEGTIGTGSIREGIAYFELVEASIPAGAFTVSATVNGTASTSQYLSIRLFTVEDAPNAATTTLARTSNFGITPLQTNIAVASADSLVVIGFLVSSSASSADFTAGFTRVTPNLINSSNNTLVLGYQAGVAAGTLSNAGSTYTGVVRGAMIALVFSP